MPTRTNRFVLRHALEDEIEKLMAFYLDNASDASPPPSVTALAKALKVGRLMVIETEGTGDLVAASATFEFSPTGYRTYVGELSGTCVTRPLNGCRPLGVQRLLLAVRLMIHAVYAAEPGEDCTNTLISIVKDDNAPSRRNIEAAGLVPVRELPGWMVYEHRSWTGDAGGGWTYYMATAATVSQAMRDLDELGLFSGCASFRREDRTNGGEEAIEIRCELNGVAMAEAVLREIEDGSQDVHLSEPPERLVR